MNAYGIREDVLRLFISLLQKVYPLVPIRRAKQPAPAINKPNIVVEMLGERSMGNDVVFNPHTQETSVAGIVEATLNIQAIGENAVELLSVLKPYLQSPSIVDLCSKTNIAINDFGEVEDLTMALDGRTWQERASVDVTVSYPREFIADADWFNKVYVTGVVVPDIDIPIKEENDGIVINVDVKSELLN